MFSEYCIYTIKHSKDLCEAIKKNGRSGRYVVGDCPELR